VTFKTGQSGNPAGRPKGSKNFATRAAMVLLEGEVEALSRKAVDMALDGDIQALRLCLERIVPRAKDAPISGLKLPELNSAEDVLGAITLVARMLSEGELLPSEASSVCSVLEQYRRHYEVTEIEIRLERLEGSHEINRTPSI
jgi:hypothetical protein